MTTLVNSQGNEEEELTIPEALVKDTRKGKIRLLHLCVMLTCVCFCYVIFILLSVFNAIIMLLSYLFHNSYASIHK